MIKLNGNIRCPKCDRGTIQFLVRQHDSSKIQFSTSCSRCKTKVYFVLTISREELLTVKSPRQFVEEKGMIVDPKPVTAEDLKQLREHLIKEEPNATQRPPVESKDNIGENKPTKGEKIVLISGSSSKLSREEQIKQTNDDIKELFDGLD